MTVCCSALSLLLYQCSYCLNSLTNKTLCRLPFAHTELRNAGSALNDDGAKGAIANWPPQMAKTIANR